MPNFPKISNPFEDETDQIDTVSPQDLAKQAAQSAGKAVTNQVIKPTAGQVNTDQAIVDFLYGTSSAPDVPQEPSSASGDPGIEPIQQGGAQQSQVAKMMNVDDPDKQMSSQAKVELTPEQKEERERARLHLRNYYTMGNKLDDIGQLEEQVAKVRQQREQEEQQRKQEEEEEAERKRQEEEEKKQEIALPSGKKTGAPQGKKSNPQQELMKREQNKTENKTGFSG